MLTTPSEGVKAGNELSMTETYAEDAIPVFSRSRAASLDQEYHSDSPLATWLSLVYYTRLG